ncbi:hypothetical protein FVE67_02095 [Thermosulfurimonas marina]|uniref:Lipoprotein n=1 Tax=Thermosulfurimonas marina TaxID=2047767 RepID=A0A6H1WR80_9BACT|nr:hypothetical protein [Thermosulfurimonas marina]QJA05664.1 hypothetical protein FVE67_02095 [Thermosulfurimonas marina]
MRKWGLLMLVFFLAACTARSQGTGGKAPVSPATPPTPVLQPTELPDLVLPSEMKIDRDRTLIVKTPTYVGGLLVARGRVTVDSLVKFFERQMLARGWEEMGRIQYKNMLLAFKRPNGSCFIYISETSFGNVEVKIWASETLGAPPQGPSPTGY